MKPGIIAGVAFTFALAVSAPAGAAEMQSKMPASPAAVSGYITAITVWSQGVHGLQAQEVAALIGVNQGAGTALEYANRHDAKAGQAWVTPWATARRAELANLRQSAAALQTDPPAPPPGVNDPTIPAVVASLRDGALKSRQMAVTTADLGEEMLGLIERTAAGDADAPNTLVVRRLDVNQVLLRGEISTTELALAALGEDHPEKDVGKATIADDLALIALLDYQKAITKQTKFDPAPYAARIREQQRTIASLAVRIRADATAARAGFAKMQDATPELRQHMNLALDTYAPSADLEEQQATTLDKIANLVSSGQGLDSAAMQQLMAEHTMIVRKRVEFDQQRNHIMAGQQ